MLAAAACASHQPPEDLRLNWPEGDPEAGQVAFVRTGCASCHLVEGIEGMPAPKIQPPVPIVFGRRAPSHYTREYLFQSIINPSLHIAESHKGAQVALGEGSRMGDFTRALTVRELIDVVAFLQYAQDQAYQ